MKSFRIARGNWISSASTVRHFCCQQRSQHSTQKGVNLLLTKTISSPKPLPSSRLLSPRNPKSYDLPLQTAIKFEKSAWLVAKLDKLEWGKSMTKPYNSQLNFDGHETITRVELPECEHANTPIEDGSPLQSGMIGDFIREGSTIGYLPQHDLTLNFSSVLKKRKEKMNKHKYKKRRKRDKFKRRNLNNIKERKKRVKEKAEERARQAMG